MNQVIDYPYSETEFIDIQPGWDSSPALVSMVDWIRKLMESDNYYWQGVPFPHQTTLFTPNQTMNGSIMVPPGTYVTSFTYYQDNTDAQPAGGFKFKVYDKGTKASIFSGDYARASVVASDMQQFAVAGELVVPSDPGSNNDAPFGPNYLLNPFIVTPPGILNWEVVNMATINTNIQILLALAVPINAQSTGNKLIKRG